MKYNLSVEFLYHTSVEVEADTPDQALEKFKELDNRAIVGKESVNVSDLEDPEAVDCYDKDWNHIQNF